MSAPVPADRDLSITRVVSLASGRDLVLRSGPEEVLEVRGADGQVEVAVVLTEQGPVLRISGVRLELQAETSSLRGTRVEIDAAELATVTSGGELVARAPLIRLN